MTKLESLTPQQEQKMEEISQYWLDYIFSCKNRVNEELATRQINWLYKFCDLDEPIVIFADSPLEGQYIVMYAKALSEVLEEEQLIEPVRDKVEAKVWAKVWAKVVAKVWAKVGAKVVAKVGAKVVAKVGDKVRDKVEAKVGAKVRDKVWAKVVDKVVDKVWAKVRAKVVAKVGDKVWDKVGDKVWAKVWDKVWAKVWDKVGAKVWDKVGAKVGAKVRAKVRAKVVAKVGDKVWDKVVAKVWAKVWAKVGANFEPFCSYGSIVDYGWVSFFDFWQSVGVTHANDFSFNEFKSLLQSGVYDTIQLNGFCVVIDMPDKIARNNRDELHCEDGPAIHFRDGYEEYFWNGVSVPEQWILNKDSITRQTIISQSNAELRRCMREILGAKRYYDIISDGKGLLLLDEDTDRQGNIMRLFEIYDDVVNKPVQFLECVCPSTKRMYNIYPPRQSARNCWDAKADTFGKNKRNFQPIIET